MSPHSLIRLVHLLSNINDTDHVFHHEIRLDWEKG